MGCGFFSANVLENVDGEATLITIRAAFSTIKKVPPHMTTAKTKYHISKLLLSHHESSFCNCSVVIFRVDWLEEASRRVRL